MPKNKSKIPLSKTHPELAKEAYGWDASSVIAGSVKKQLWKCIKGHVYEASPENRTGKKTSCPICANRKVLKGFNDLATTHQDLAKEAHGWDPATVTFGSGLKKAWKCGNSHIYESSIYQRTGKQASGCPICLNKRVLKGFNDLATTHPDLAREAHGWDPTTVIAGSSSKKNWKCFKGHEYLSSPVSRSSGSHGCATCANQKLLKGFNDLATTHPDLAKEAHGWDPATVIAGSNRKRNWRCPIGHIYEAILSGRSGSQTGCSICSGKKVLKGFNDLATTHPDLAKEAHGWDPTTVIAGSNKKRNWKCPIGHIFSIDPNHRKQQNSSCPICLNKRVLKGFNDLKTTHPDLAKEAHGWDPTKIIAGSHNKSDWKCSKGHIYQAAIYSRSGAGNKCPVCDNQKVLIGFNDLATTHPEIASEAVGWDPTKFVAGSGSKKTWRCKLGHDYEAVLNARTGLRQTNCPICANLQILIGFNDLATTHPNLAKEADGWDPKTVVSGSAARLKWKCSNGHSYFGILNNRTSLQNSGCPSCADSGFDPNENGYLYFLEHQKFEMYQIGITNVPESRLAKHKKAGWKVLELRGPMDGQLTRQWERAILEMLKFNRADLSNSKIAGKFDGYSEAWSKSTFPTKSIKELMHLTEKFEDNK